ncbi:c-type cytochrome, methanol metabolism-related [Paracoccus sp. YIM 132242]|uniref:C-type cytochrome, methanol metabolism-related n=1 Tax=Paracoccus lichenicola TaxID=2665644 RepID=A0A6L6HRF1_9RHOB|nr:c-type cytochrome, methanol metabolism-related [Paracoccus lichenicola]MTE00813.1 c-type cytochrome, methanol metabolism-related [Paracoccus lichenicola]
MNAITSLASLALAASVATTALAQDATTPTPPPAEAGAGAAAATSGAAPAAAEPAASGASDAPVAMAEGATTLPNGMDITPATQENGRWYNAEGIPTYKIDNGVVDFATFNGFRRYSAECHVCHGPDGEGSTYAPALKNSVLRMDYYAFQEIVASGKQDVNSAANLVMPAFGTNKNVWCYIDDIYVYLLARGTDELPRGRPGERADKSEEYTAQEDSCMSM